MKYSFFGLRKKEKKAKTHGVFFIEQFYLLLRSQSFWDDHAQTIQEFLLGRADSKEEEKKKEIKLMADLAACCRALYLAACQTKTLPNQKKKRK